MAFHPSRLLSRLPDRYRQRALLALVIVTAAIGGAWLGSLPMTGELESRYGLGWLYRMRGAQSPPDSVLIVELNEAAGERLTLPIPRDGALASDCAGLAADVTAKYREPLGSPRLQPWPRCVHARLVDALTEAGARAIVFDVVFRPPRFRSGAEREALEAIEADFARAIERSGRVVMAIKVQNLACTQDCPPVARVDLSRPLLDAAAAAGPMLLPTPRGDLYHEFSVFDPEDFGLGTLPLLALHTGRPEILRKLVERIAVEIPRLRDTLPEIPADAPLEPTQLSGLVTELRVLLTQVSPLEIERLAARGDLPARVAQWYRKGKAPGLLNEYGPTGTLPAIGYADVIRLAQTAPDQLEKRVAGRTVFIGYLQHEEKEPFEQFPSHFRVDGLPDVSGVELVATAFANLEHDTQLRAVPNGSLITAAAAVLLAAVTLIAGPGVGGVLLLVGGTAFVGASAWLFSARFVWMPLLAPLAAAAVAYGGTVLLQYERELRRMRRLHDFLSGFVPPGTVEELLERRKSGRRTSYGLCLVTDAQGFTSFAEARPPEVIASFLDRYFELLFRPIIENRGYVSDVVGDSMLAIFPCNGPEDAPVAAVLDASLAILAAIDAANEGDALPTRIGITMGPMTQTMIGAFGHWEYRAVGDIVNTANRVQALNKTLQTRALVTDVVAKAARGYRLRDRGTYALSGKTQHQHVHELLGRE